jgi:integral membrane sensor domain MASE1
MIWNQPCRGCRRKVGQNVVFTHAHGTWYPNTLLLLFFSVAGVRFTPGGICPGASGHNVTFIHPKGNETSPIGGAGVLIELVQAPANVIVALSPVKK